MPFLMIDDAGTRDRDDAVQVTPVPAGGWQVVVHIADVAAHVPIGSNTDLTAFTRMTSKYLPTKTVPMLGQKVEQAASLAEDREQATLQIAAQVRADGTIGDVTVARGRVSAGDCVAVDYQRAAAALTDPEDPVHTALVAAQDAAQALLAARARHGAFAFYRLDQGWASGEDGTVVQVAPSQRTSAYVIVAELMVLANTAVSRWAAEQGVSILFRNHERNPVADTPAGQAAALVAAASDPRAFSLALQRTLSTMRPATYGAAVLGHHALSLPSYTHVTAPLRRYADLASQRALFAHLDGTGPAYDEATLVELAGNLTRRIAESKQRTADRHKQADARRVQQLVASSPDLSILSEKDWRAALAAAAAGPAVPAFVDELTRRAESRLISPADVATLLDAGTEWAPVLSTVLTAAADGQPELAPSIWSHWTQTHPEAGEVRVDAVQEGPPHAPVFTARATLGERVGPWRRGESKKLAQQAAMWALLLTIAGLETPGDEAVPASAPTQSGAGGSPSAPGVPVGSERSWQKHLSAAVDGPFTPQVGAELESRTKAGTLTIADAAAVLDGDDSWAPARRAVLVAAREQNPSWAPSILTHWQQRHPGVPTPRYEERAVGPSHEPVFQARVVVTGLAGPWQAGPSKKAARQSAVWELLPILAGDTASRPVDEHPTPVQSPDRPAKTPPKATPVAAKPAATSREGDGRAVVELTDVQHRKALKNPVSWLNQHAAARGLPKPEWPIVPDPGGDGFVCVASLGDIEVTGRAKGKQAAKNQAAETLVNTVAGRHQQKGSHRG